MNLMLMGCADAVLELIMSRIFSDFGRFWPILGVFQAFLHPKGQIVSKTLKIH